MTYTVTYTIPGKGSVSSKGHTIEGVRSIMASVLKAGGAGSVLEDKELSFSSLPLRYSWAGR
jgi:hypothetical protein